MAILLIRISVLPITMGTVGTMGRIDKPAASVNCLNSLDSPGLASYMEILGCADPLGLGPPRFLRIAGTWGDDGASAIHHGRMVGYRGRRPFDGCCPGHVERGSQGTSWSDRGPVGSGCGTPL